MRIRQYLLVASVAAAPALGHAQAIDMSHGGPVTVTAVGGFEWRQGDQTVIAQDDARAVRGNVTVLADQLLAHYRKKAGTPDAATPANSSAPAGAPGAAAGGGAAPTTTADGQIDTGDSEVYRLEADGHVRIVTPTDEAVGDHGIYDIDQAVLVLTGKALKLTTPQQIMTARDEMEYWSQKRMAVGRGHAVVITTDGRRLAGDVLVGYFAPPTATPPPGSATPVAATQVAAAPVDAAQVATAPVKPPADPIAASGKLQRVEAFGNVEVRTTADIVRGDRGVYLPDTGMARILGHVRITHGQNQLNGPAADVNMKTGIAHMISLPGVDRVSGLIMPNDAQSKADLTAKPK